MVKIARQALLPLCFLSACVDENVLSVYGLAEQYQGSIVIVANSCQSGSRSLVSHEDIQGVRLAQTESGTLEFWFSRAEYPHYGQLCRLEGERPVGLCLYGKHLESYQVTAPNQNRLLSCQLWTELLNVEGSLDCCERIEDEQINTLRLTEEGTLVGTLSVSLSLEEEAESEGLCGGSLACEYALSLQMSPSP